MLLAGLLCAVCAARANAALQCGLEESVPVVISVGDSCQDDGDVYQRTGASLDLTAVSTGSPFHGLSGILELAGLDDRLVEIGIARADLDSKPVRRTQSVDVVPIADFSV